MQKRATAPWNSVNTLTTKPGRPRKTVSEKNGRPGCMWPQREGGTACRRQVEQGKALCPDHAKILGGGPGTACAWPGCPQSAPFRSLCSYHHKRAHGLLDATR